MGGKPDFARTVRWNRVVRLKNISSEIFVFLYSTGGGVSIFAKIKIFHWSVFFLITWYDFTMDEKTFFSKYGHNHIPLESSFHVTLAICTKNEVIERYIHIFFGYVNNFKYIWRTQFIMWFWISIEIAFQRWKKYMIWPYLQKKSFSSIVKSCHVTIWRHKKIVWWNILIW